MRILLLKLKGLAVKCWSFLKAPFSSAKKLFDKAAEKLPILNYLRGFWKAALIYAVVLWAAGSALFFGLALNGVIPWTLALIGMLTYPFIIASNMTIPLAICHVLGVTGVMVMWNTCFKLVAPKVVKHAFQRVQSVSAL